MNNPEQPIKDLLQEPIHMKVEDTNLDFETAREIAREKAREISTDPMLLSWYKGETGEYYPKFDCGFLNKPAWIVYAQSRGGDITIDINDETYVFIFMSYDRPTSFYEKYLKTE